MVHLTPISNNSVKTKKYLNRFGGFVNTEYMIVIAIIGILMAVAIPKFMNATAWRKGISCLENIIKIVEGTDDSTKQCPISKLPYPPKKTGIISCPDPKQHLHTKPRFILENNNWIFKQNLPKADAKESQPIFLSTGGIFSTITFIKNEKSILVERKTKIWFRYVLRLIFVLGVLGLGVWRTAVSENIGCFIVVLISVLGLVYFVSHDKSITITEGSRKIEIIDRYFGKALKPKMINNIRALYPLKKRKGSYSVLIFYFEDGKIENRKLFKLKNDDLSILSPIHEAIFSP
jgi:hypothetical protein